MNSKKEINQLNLDNILKNPEIKNLIYYNINYILEEIPDDICDNITDTSINIENIKLREISPYFSGNYDENVIPCYKEKENKCQEKNEFDYEKEEKYNATLYEGSDQHYEAYYQIDKSSESHLVYSNIKFEFNQMNDDSLQIILLFEVYYIKFLFKEFKEIPEVFNNIFNM